MRSGFSSLRTLSARRMEAPPEGGYVFQDFRLLPGRTALEKRLLRPRSHRFAEKVDSAPRRNDSSGKWAWHQRPARWWMSSRVSSSASPSHAPWRVSRSFFSRDEPTRNLDERATHGIMELFWEINALGMAV